MIYYTLNTNIDGNKILGDIQKLVNKFPQSELINKVLVIKLENINDHNGDSPLLKLEYKDL
jgi:ADP-dependent phosphofructokinase/glucokinase